MPKNENVLEALGLNSKEVCDEFFKFQTELGDIAVSDVIVATQAKSDWDDTKKLAFIFILGRFTEFNEMMHFAQQKLIIEETKIHVAN